MAQSRPQTPQGRNDQPNNSQEIRTQRALESIAAELKTLREQAAAKEQREATRDAKPGEPVWSNWILIVVTAGAVWAAFRTLGQIREQVIANKDEASAAKANAEAVLLAERAYLGISHTPPGLRPDRTHGFLISFGIHNSGKTPAEILGGKVFFTSTETDGFQCVDFQEEGTLGFQNHGTLRCRPASGHA